MSTTAILLRIALSVIVIVALVLGVMILVFDSQEAGGVAIGYIAFALGFIAAIIAMIWDYRRFK